jgi:hypothetical protein
MRLDLGENIPVLAKHIADRRRNQLVFFPVNSQYTA